MILQLFVLNRARRKYEVRTQVVLAATVCYAQPCGLYGSYLQAASYHGLRSSRLSEAQPASALRLWTDASGPPIG